MHDQPRFEPLEGTSLFPDKRSARHPVDGTIARGQLNEDDHMRLGKVGGDPVQSFPFPITKDILLRGKTMFAAQCAPCHGLTGSGQGMVVQRGFPAPPTLHQKRLREAPVGHFFDVITNGYGKMFPAYHRVRVKDRWAIIAYIRALQRSQNAHVSDIPKGKRKLLDTPQGTDQFVESLKSNEKPD